MTKEAFRAISSNDDNDPTPNGPADHPRDLLSNLSSSKAVDPAYARRLSDKIMAAFHCACDDNKPSIAADLLDVLEFIISRPPFLPAGWERRTKESLVAAHERLWSLRHREPFTH